MSLKSGARLGPYEIVSLIGEGGMGQVYRATEISLGRSVAIKVLPASLSADRERMARFEREARTLASLNHPSIAAIYGFETYDGVRALVMEFVDGEDLSQRLERGAIPLADALPIARQIADALETAHERGIIHRDLKPANIRIRSDGTVKVLDFGLAKALDPAAATSDEAMNAATITSPAVTHAGMILGTAAYMAPEQARGRVVDRRADIWAFGVVLYEMLSGRRTFAGADVTDLIVAVVTREPDWSALPPIPAPLRRLLERTLKKDPKVRLRDIGEARLQIDELMTDVGAGFPGPGEVEGSRPNASRPVTRSNALTWIFAAAAVAFATTALLLWAPWHAAPTPGIPDWGFSRKTFVPQAVFAARFMPDKQTIVFSSAIAGASPGLFEVRTESLEPRPFGPPRTHLLSVSKSGELAVLTNAVYLSHRLFTGTLARMNIDGTPRELAKDVREADWLADGSDLVVVREVPGGDQLEFPVGHVVHRTTGYLSDPRVSPDGTRVAFMEHPLKGDDRGWVKVVDRAGVVKTLAGEFAEEEGIAWADNGQTVLFAQTQIRAVPLAGGAARSLTNNAGKMYLLDAASDGRLIVIRDDTNVGVVAKGAGQKAERDLTMRAEWGPTLSTDGRFVAFTRSGAPDYHVLMRTADGQPPQRLGPGNVWAFSPGGEWVTASLPSKGRCVVYPTGAGKAVTIELGPLASCSVAFWFPDGKQLVLIGREKDRPDRAYAVGFPSGTPRALLPEGLLPQAVGSSSGCLLAKDAAGTWLRFDGTGATTAVRGLGPADHLVGCSTNSLSAFVADNAVVPAVVYRVDLQTGNRQKIADIAPVDRAGLLDVSLTVYRENGHYAYDYVRGLTTLFVATPRK